MNKKMAAPKNRKNQKEYDTPSAIQRSRLLDELSTAGAHGRSTIELREGVGVMHPAGRVQELREEGHVIHTLWDVTENAQRRRHRNARYVLVNRARVSV